MGKSGGRRKKGGNSAPSDASHPSPPAANGVDLDSPLFLKRAHELKEEGNRRFQTKDYAGALDQYNKALQLTPKTHPDRAVFHSNRAACLMQMKPVDYDTVVSECSLALEVQPRFGRALLRRARAYEALAKYDLALQDVQALLVADPNHRDVLEIAGRLRVALGPRNEAQQDLQSRPSPAALGASAVRGAPISGLGPCLPARPVPKKTAPSGSQATASSKPDKPVSQIQEQSSLKTVSKPFKLSSEPVLVSPRHSNSKNSKDNSLQRSVLRAASVSATTIWRPLKLVYDHDIRLAQMPANCSFRVLREIVAKRFPSSKSVLVKYKDMEGDLVTITTTEELRLAESSADHLNREEKPEGSETGKDDLLMVLRLHVVEVDPEQEPALVEEEEKPAAVEDEGVKVDESASHCSAEDSVSGGMENEVAVPKAGTEEEIQKEKIADSVSNNVECKEVEIDDWLYEFAQLFRTHVGIDPDAHIDLHELGMELCSEALEETLTSEEAQSLFEMAVSKFQEVAALAFFNWGNVHMCAARKRIPLDESSPKEVMTQQLQNAYDWVQERYSLAGQKYEEALRIKPDFYEGLLALGQQHFETAKLQWSFALANKIDLTNWDYEETIKLFDSAEEKMKAATEMWEKIEEQRTNEVKNPNASKRDELLKRRKKQAVGTDGQPSGEVLAELTAEEAAEEAAVMRSQIHLFWGNMLFERSQVEFKLGQGGWKKNLDAAVERFKLAGASEIDISVVIKNHLSNGVGADGDEKKTSAIGVDGIKVNGEHEVISNIAGT
ncbi:protein CLMP1-like [Aristolochia californica]|uniref:protein CLMP1-like n=1 Tax=Aristolochia californica TaxID=171875 RepID=UPI0035DA14EE